MRKNTLLIIVLLTVSTYSKNLKSICNLEEQMVFTADNVINNLYVDNTRVLKLLDVNWKKASTYKTKGLLKPGAVIKIDIANGVDVRGKKANANTGSYAGLLGTITYKTADGGFKQVNTSGDWMCSGKPARQLNTNDDKSSHWYKERKSFFSEIDSKAWWIWDETGERFIQCTFTIPN